MGLVAAGVIGTVGALVGLALQFSPNPPLAPRYAMFIDVAFAVLGMVVGTMILVNQTGTRRNVGIAFLAICLSAVLGGIVIGSQASGGKGASRRSQLSPRPTEASAPKTDAPATAATPVATTPVAAPAVNPAAATTPPANSPAAKPGLRGSYGKSN